MGDNQLEGGIPAELGSLGNLESLDLGRNRLTGEIPTELGNLGNLELLFLDNNGLTGEIPGELGNLNLMVSYLGGNQFSGCVRATLRSIISNDWGGVGLPFCD